MGEGTSAVEKGLGPITLIQRGTYHIGARETICATVNSTTRREIVAAMIRAVRKGEGRSSGWRRKIISGRERVGGEAAGERRERRHTEIMAVRLGV